MSSPFRAIRSAAFFVRRLLKAYGIDLATMGRAIAKTPRFIRDYCTYKRSAGSSGEAGRKFPARAHLLSPHLTDFDDSAGSLGVYFHQDLWAARKVYARRPALHIDVGSRIDGFVAHLLVFMPVQIVDVRPMSSDVENLSFKQSDATRMEMFETNSVESISSLHAAEHFGLGRYGDPIDPNGCFTFMRSLQRVLRPGGRLLFSVPIGDERLNFNANRVFAPDTILKTFDQLQLVSFAAAGAKGALVDPADPGAYLKARYKVGLFEFTK